MVDSLNGTNVKSLQELHGPPHSRTNKPIYSWSITLRSPTRKCYHQLISESTVQSVCSALAQSPTELLRRPHRSPAVGHVNITVGATI